jgi:hypothetical protein
MDPSRPTWNDDGCVGGDRRFFRIHAYFRAFAVRAGFPDSSMTSGLRATSRSCRSAVLRNAFSTWPTRTSDRSEPYPTRSRSTTDMSCGSSRAARQGRLLAVRSSDLAAAVLGGSVGIRGVAPCGALGSGAVGVRTVRTPARGCTRQKPRTETDLGAGLLIVRLAAPYSPTGWPRQYHPRGRA